MSAVTPTLDVDRLAVRYLVPGGTRAPADVAWLDRLLADLLHRHLDEALAAAGLAATGHLCLSRLTHRVLVRRDAADGINTRAWAEALARAVAQAVAAADTVAYRHDADVVADVVASACRGDLTRRWAWEQTGVVEPTWPADPVTVLVRTVVSRRPESLGVLRAVAGRAPALVETLGWQAWVRLATGAGEAAEHGAAAHPHTVERGRRALAAEPVAAALASLARRAPRNERDVAAVARLALRLADPSLPRGTLADPVVIDLLTGTGRRSTSPPQGAAPEDRLAGRAVDAAAPEGPRRQPERPRRAPADRREAPREPADPARAGEGPSAAGRSGGDARPAGAAGVAGAGGRDAADAEPAREPEVASTLLGGLPFVLHLVADLDVPGRVADPAHPLGSRPLRWVLHALGRELTAAEAADPAALAFAGLAPSDDPPSGESPGPGRPTHRERRALGALAGELAGELSERLAPSDPDGSPAPGERLADLCRRPALVAADPGWIEVRLRLDDVSLPVRRAGLDLDPGFVPFLGVVVRFSYA